MKRRSSSELQDCDKEVEEEEEEVLFEGVRGTGGAGQPGGAAVADDDDVEVDVNDDVQYLIKWRGLSYMHVEWVAPPLLKEHGIWGPMRAKRFLESPEAQVQLDDDELRMGQGRDWPGVEAYFEEDLMVVDRILAERHVVVDKGDFGITAKAAGALRIERLARLKVMESSGPAAASLTALLAADAAAEKIEKAAQAQLLQQQQVAEQQHQKQQDELLQQYEESGSVGPPPRLLPLVLPPPLPAPTRREREEQITASLNAASSGPVDVDDDAPVNDGKPRRVCVLIKWKGLPYSESTWEWADDIHDDEALARFRLHNRLPTLKEAMSRVRFESAPGEDERPPPNLFREYLTSPPFKGDRQVRDYQLEGVNWLIYNWFQRRNCEWPEAFVSALVPSVSLTPRSFPRSSLLSL